MTNDTDVHTNVAELLKLFPDWNLLSFQNIETAWLAFLREQPDAMIIDLDLIREYTVHPDRRQTILRVAPIVTLLSSRPIHQESKQRLITDLRASGYIVKPIDLDVITLNLSIASKPRQEAPEYVNNNSM